MQKTTFIYALCEPGTRTVRYIGKTGNPKQRLQAHRRKVSARKTTPLGQWLGSVSALGTTPDMVVLREVPIEQGGLAEERYIRIARGCGMALVNSNDGGGGPTTHTPEARKKMSFAHMGEKNHFFGETHTPEVRDRLSKVAKGRRLPPRTPEYCAEKSVSQRGEKNHQFGRVYTLEERKAMSAAQSGENHYGFGGHLSDEHKAAISTGKKAANARRKQRDQEIEWALAPYTLE